MCVNDRERRVERRRCKEQLSQAMGGAQEGCEAGWSGWRQVHGVICDRRRVAGMKGKDYKMLVRSGLGTAALTKRQEVEVEVAAQAERFGNKVGKAGMVWTWIVDILGKGC